MIELIRNHNSQILSHMDRAEGLIGMRPPENLDALTAARTELMASLQEYALLKHASIFCPLINQDGAHAAQARKMKADSIAAAETFRQYARKWNSCAVGLQWEVYRAEALAMITRIRAHLRSEIRALTALLMASGMQDAEPQGYGCRPGRPTSSRPDEAASAAVSELTKACALSPDANAVRSAMPHRPPSSGSASFDRQTSRLSSGIDLSQPFWWTKER